MHEFGASFGLKISTWFIARCGHSPQTRVQCGFAPAWRIGGTEAALLVPIDLFQQFLMVLLTDRGVDVPGRVS